jgi:hypothetical protein
MLESPSPQAYREKNPYTPPPRPYKPPSVLWEYKGLAILFAVVAIAFGLYCLKGTHAGNRGGSSAPVATEAPQSPAQPVYIETVPPQDKR